MNSKRSHHSSKSGSGGSNSGGSSSSSNNSMRHGGKGKDSSKPSSSRGKIDSHGFRSSFQPTTFSFVKLEEIPTFSSILNRSVEEGVAMDDLDPLQQDLEKCLSKCAVRHRLLKSKLESLDLKDKKKDKKDKPHDRSSPSTKRKRPSIPIKTFTATLPLLPPHEEPPMLCVPKNETAEKFWDFVEPYCAPIAKSDITFLESLIKECSQDFPTKIPELGCEYGPIWPDEPLARHEANHGHSRRSSKTKSANDELRKFGTIAVRDTIGNPLTERLLSALIENKPINKLPAVNNGLRPIDFNLAKLNHGLRSNMCMDRRLKKELVEQGILDMEDLTKEIPEHDNEILRELKSCLQELKIVNERNVTQLHTLRSMITKELQRQEVQDALDKVDLQIMELYKKILLEKQKYASRPGDDKVSYKHILSKYDEEAKKLCQKQATLSKALAELTIATLPTGID